MIVLSLLASGIIIQPSSAATSSTLDIYCDPDDTYVNEMLPNENYVNSQTLEVGYYYHFEFPGRVASLLHFNIGLLPDDAEILEASLVLYKTGGDHDAQLLRVQDAWDGTTVTWNSKPDHYSSSGVIWNIPSTDGFVSVDVKTWVQNWFDEVYVNQGILIRVNPTTPSTMIT